MPASRKDMGVPEEQDLAMEDLAAADLRAPRDLGAPADLGRSPDLSVPADLARPPADLAMPSADLARPPADLATPPGDLGPGAIGDPCSADGQCKAGRTPLCWRTTVRNMAGMPPTPGGYCSSPCMADAECGAGASCIPVGDQPFCLKHCRNATTCRHPGYACAFVRKDGVCYPDTIFDCDPRAMMGTCTEDNMGVKKPGGCLRGAFEDKGNCSATCQLGAPAPCAPLGGVMRQCQYFVGTPDPFVGLVCMQKPAVPVMPGGACAYINECTEGYQCDTLDGRCRKLCIKGGLPECSAGMMCVDVFMTPALGAGLCR